eukprot:IDg8722t1
MLEFAIVCPFRTTALQNEGPCIEGYPEWTTSFQIKLAIQL